MRFVDLPIRFKFSITAGLTFAILITVVVFLGSRIMMAATENETRQRAADILARDTAIVTDEIGSAITATKMAASGIEGMLANPGITRDLLGAFVTQTVVKRPAIIGSTLAFDAQVIDGRDAEFTQHPYSDKIGRFVPYFYHHSDGSVGVEKLVMTKEAGTENWYDKPMREDRDLLTSPYIYRIDGTDVLMTTISTVIHKAGKPAGILTTDLALTKISAFINELKPFGTGHVSLIATDNLWVSHSNRKLLGTAATDDLSKTMIAAAGQPGRLITDDKRVSQYVLSALVHFPGVAETWTLILSVPEKVMIADAVKARSTMITSGLTALAIVLIIVWFGAHLLSRPLVAITRAMKMLAGGDTSQSVPGAGRRDEIGAMAAAVEVFRENAIKATALARDKQIADQQAQAEREQAMLDRQALAAEAAEARLALEEQAARDRAAALRQMADTFETSVSHVVHEVAAAALHLQTEARDMASLATRSQARAAAVAAAAQEASASVEAVAAASEELAVSIREIGRRVDQSSQTAQNAATEAGRANATVAGLNNSSSRIGAVVGLIETIAAQTNLLALNATIEAARAGDAGKGFAVVAGEVKALAGQTSQATNDIHLQVTGVQAATLEAVTAIEAIGTHINEVADITAAIAAAVEQQASATMDIARNIEQAAAGTQEVTANIDGVSEASESTGTFANQCSTAAAALARHCEHLRGEVAKFIINIRKN